jgi:hypothetical protein
MRSLLVAILPFLVLILASPAALAADPTDNPIATFYSGPEGYPAWTDSINWQRVINMKTYAKGKNDFQKFQNAQRELSETGGVLYYPAGTYDFTTKDPGRGLMLVRGVVIRGEAPPGRPVASTDGKLTLPTKFLFKFRDRQGGKTPGDWNFIGLGVDDARDIKSEDHLGIAWVHLVGATVAFGPEVDWSKTWAKGKSLLTDKIKAGSGWAQRDPSGTHPIDVFMGGGKKYKGGTNGRFVFGCVFEDAAVLDDFLDPGYGPNGFSTSRHCARVIVYGARVLVANNALPRSGKTFMHNQKTSINKGERQSLVSFDYARTGGIDINKDLLLFASEKGACPGYFEQGVVVRDNWVFNHGHTGYSISGNWVTIANNHNERVFLHATNPREVITLDGWEAATRDGDNRSRAFDLAGRNLWVDHNTFNNTGSTPGNDGEGIVARSVGGTPIHSWAITHNVHTKGTGALGGMGGMDVDCHGLLIAWNQTPGWVGNLIGANARDVKMTDCAFLANKCNKEFPDVKTIKRLGIAAPLVKDPSLLSPPSRVTAETFDEDHVKISWSANPQNGIGYRVERRLGAAGKWQVIAYRPPHLQGDPDNPQVWVDFTAPPGKDLIYRVVSITSDDNDMGASAPTKSVKLLKPQ